MKWLRTARPVLSKSPEAPRYQIDVEMHYLQPFKAEMINPFNFI